MAKSIITQEWLRSYFSYDPLTGVLVQTRKYGGSNPRKIGAPIGLSDRKGYLRARFLGRLEFLHRVVWLFAYGDWPSNQIDHINGNKSDNRLPNLREASPSENKRNQNVRRDSGSGLKGVHQDKRTGRWRAKITVNGKVKNLGFFATIEEAQAARLSGSILHGSFARETGH